MLFLAILLSVTHCIWSMQILMTIDVSRAVNDDDY